MKSVRRGLTSLPGLRFPQVEFTSMLSITLPLAIAHLLIAGGVDSPIMSSPSLDDRPAPASVATMPDAGFHAGLWQRFCSGDAMPGARPEFSTTTTDSSQDVATVPPSAVSGLLIPEAEFRIDQVFPGDPLDGPQFAESGFDDWQQAAMNSHASHNSGISTGGPSVTTFVVGIVALIVMVGTFLMPR